MIYIVDGTGPADDREYRSEMENSYCRQIDRTSTTQSQYWRGPSLLGFETGQLGYQVASSIRRKSTSAIKPIFLCGYSRGGAAVIHAAQLIYPTPVAAMFLFDAVDRTAFLEARSITSNVQKVFFAQRDPVFSKKAEQTIHDSRYNMKEKMAVLKSTRNPVVSALFGAGHDVDSKARSAINEHATVALAEKHKLWAGRSRGISDFSNCGLNINPPERLKLKTFAGTHGALGGVPWRDIAGDHAIAQMVKNWMWLHLESQGVFAG